MFPTSELGKKLNRLSLAYHPLTSTPFLRNAGYCEIPPSDVLRPYIRCFWGNERPQVFAGTAGRLVIPDTCMDIIVNVNHTDRTVTACFCAMDEHSYPAGGNSFVETESDGSTSAGTESVISSSAATGSVISSSAGTGSDISSTTGTGTGVLSSTFGIRFYFWSAVLFGSMGFQNTKNRTFNPDEFISGITGELTDVVLRYDTLQERVCAAEAILLQRLDPDRLNSDLMNAVNDMIVYCGRRKISGIARQNALSERRMERIFAENIGVSPKTLSNLIRYQLVWQEFVRGGADILTMVEKYGYTDQAHLLHDFRLRHGMTPAQALRTARAAFL